MTPFGCKSETVIILFFSFFFLKGNNNNNNNRKEEMHSGRYGKYGRHRRQEMAMMEHQDGVGVGWGWGRRAVYKVDWRDERKRRMEGKEGMEGWMESICRGSCVSSCHASVREAASPSSRLPDVTSSPRPPAPPPCRGLSHRSRLPSASPLHPSLPAILPRTQPRLIPAFKNGAPCERAMQMRWLLPHCSSSRAEETLIG